MSKARRIPRQSRSQEKYDQILASAKELIGKKGNDSVSMREISKHSGVALASIYQYFDDKNAILQAIMQDFFKQVRQSIESSLDGCQSIDELIVNMHQNIDTFYSLLKRDPIFAMMWAGLQANPELVKDDAKDSQQNAHIITEKVCLHLGEEKRQEIYNATLLLVHMIGSTIRLALTMPEEDAGCLVNEIKSLVKLRLRSFNI
jgi:AcrR family transcriptional regulator